eukprot:m.79976 g.79976  ORF g.79976 m.79976 type:complete len:345 (-) comp12586_c0_seq2:238-1272(-)
MFRFAAARSVVSASIRAQTATLLNTCRTMACQRVCVVGHKVPDTDAICSAIVRAEELKANGVNATPYRLGDLNPETKFVLEQAGLEPPPLLDESITDCQLAVVDTNNPAELPDNIHTLGVHSIVDHHKLVAGLHTDTPIEIDIRPLCSAGSILFHRFQHQGLDISKTTARLMLSCILSDSLHFRSPTTTPSDITAAETLGSIAEIDVDTYGEAMLKAKSQVSHLTDANLIMMDSKVYEIGGLTSRVSVVETTDATSVLERATGLVTSMEQVTQEQKLGRLLFFVVDIVKQEAVLITADPQLADTVARAFDDATVQKDAATILVTLPGVLSRKKQILPTLEHVLG